MRPLPYHTAASAFICSTALLCAAFLPAQNSAVAPRITANVDESSLMTLKGNVPQLARAQYDQGEAPGSTQMTHMRLVLKRSTEQQAALDKFMGELQDKSSPNYHKWLTPIEFGKLYGPADSDIAALVAWLESHGLKLETVSLGRTNIAFSGTLSQVEEAFHTSIHSFTANGRQFFSNTSDPQIPSALAPVVMGVAHLNTIQPRPHYVRGSTGRFNPESKRLEPVNGASPYLTLPNEPYSAYFLFVVPADAATIYDTPNSYNANFAGGTSYTGAGVKIGVGGDAVISASNVVNFRSVFLGSTYATGPTMNYCTSSNSCSATAGGGYDSEDEDEAYIDTELSGGIAPGAAIYYYASGGAGDLTTGIEAAIDANVVDIFSLSFGDCEADMGTSGNAQINSYWQQAATQGIAVMVSTGDSGSAGCDYDVNEASGGLQVSGFATTPYNVAVGGTDFYALNNSFTTYVSTSQGSSSTFYRTALGYIPESTWNDSTTVDTTISANVTSTNTCATGNSTTNILAGSGGASSVYSKPSWQSGTGVPADGKRDIPDVSLMAGNGCDPASWLICTADPAGSGEANCATQSDGDFYFEAYGGTSTAAPTFAGILALVEQKTGGRLGQSAGELQELYTLYGGSHANSIFHDQSKVGNIAVVCSDGSANCDKNTAGYYFESGYNTNASGYDLATGLGSVDATQLVTYWGSTNGTVTATLGATPTPNPVTTVESLSVPVTVTGGSGTPTGTVTLAGGGYTSAAESLVSGDYTFSVPAGSLAIGDDSLTVTYSGDSTYAANNISTSVQVNGLTATVTATPTATSINSNQSVTVTGTVSGSGGTPTGSVTLSGGGYTSAATALSSGSYSITIPPNSLTAGGDTLTVTYGGNSVYDAGAFGTTSVMVTLVVVLAPTVTVVPASTSIDSSQSLNVTVTVAGSGATPTGTVTLASGSYSSVAQTLGSGSCTAASCTITIPSNSLNSSLNGRNDTLTATYSGDTNYHSGVGTAMVTVAESVFMVTASAPSSVSPGGNATATVSASSSLFYSGTVTVSCTLQSYPNGAQDLPTCVFANGSMMTLSAGTPSPVSVTASVETTAATSELVYPKIRGTQWAGAAGGALMALLVFLGIPARRRSWRQMLGILVLIAALGSLASCGSVSNTGGGNQGNPGTTAGNYVFTVTGAGNPSVTPAPSTTFTVTVN